MNTVLRVSNRHTTAKTEFPEGPYFGASERTGQTGMPTLQDLIVTLPSPHLLSQKCLLPPPRVSSLAFFPFLLTSRCLWLASLLSSVPSFTLGTSLPSLIYIVYSVGRKMFPGKGEPIGTVPCCKQTKATVALLNGDGGGHVCHL